MIALMIPIRRKMPCRMFSGGGEFVESWWVSGGGHWSTMFFGHRVVCYRRGLGLGSLSLLLCETRVSGWRIFYFAWL